MQCDRLCRSVRLWEPRGTVSLSRYTCADGTYIKAQNSGVALLRNRPVTDAGFLGFSKTRGKSRSTTKKSYIYPALCWLLLKFPPTKNYQVGKNFLKSFFESILPQTKNLSNFFEKLELELSRKIPGSFFLRTFLISFFYSGGEKEKRFPRFANAFSFAAEL